MGLLAILLAKTNQGTFLKRIVGKLPFCSVLCALVGLFLLLYLPVDGQFRKTYFSENALLPHQGVTFVRSRDWVGVNSIRDEIRSYEENGIPVFLQVGLTKNIFEQFDVKVYTHDWSHADGSFGGTNIYGIVRATRGTQNEAAVIAAPWTNMEGRFNEGGVAVLLGLARHFTKWTMLHKNLIFVIPSNSEVALRRWVDAYHTTLQHTAGNIEGAIVLDYASSSDKFQHIDIGFEGLNGQLPNLDLVNTAGHSAMSEFVDISILGSHISRAQSYSTRLHTLFRNIYQQAGAGIVNDYPSAMFSGWHIDAITLRAVEGNRNDITAFGRVCESTFR